MSTKLQRRAREFIAREIPNGFNYVSDSISERVIAVYADRRRIELDQETEELLEICAAEAINSSKGYGEEVRAFFLESGAILEAILSEARQRARRPWWKLWR